ncbi:SDR family oxidoreductase [Shimazuella sp. AN120528]|uniref:SDR family oxidoreductase n=1 Tax=Shimazuella soli TaxID=1892854 RepID=UPI001F0F3B77|nr:SDR family oxidoreductase [Shimazuella soli]MCH5586064.1 SDR family oxidoreductase [Shimazuella soli]
MCVAVVTGASRGIGKEVCRQLGEMGYQVCLTGRNEDVVHKVVEELSSNGSIIYGHQLDVTDSKSICRLRDFIVNQFGRIDVLVNNAGVFLDNETNGKCPSLLEMNVQLLRLTMETNVYGVLNLIQIFFPYMKQANYGRIVNVSSGMGRITSMEMNDLIRRDLRYGPFYRISKASLNILTRIIAAEVNGFNILVNAVCPGWVQTDMGGSDAVRSVEEGAKGVVWAATLPDNHLSGAFFRDGKQLNW